MKTPTYVPVVENSITHKEPSCLIIRTAELAASRHSTVERHCRQHSPQNAGPVCSRQVETHWCRSKQSVRTAAAALQQDRTKPHEGEFAVFIDGDPKIPILTTYEDVHMVLLTSSFSQARRLFVKTTSTQETTTE